MPGLPAIKPFPWKCGHCRERAVHPATVPYTTEADYDGRTYTVTLPDLQVPRCQKCGELVLDAAANRQITEALRRQLRLLTPEQIRRHRESLGLTQKQLAAHLGIAEATLSRWETGGQIQQRALDRLLRLYFSSPAVRETLADEDRLAALAATPTPPAETVAESDPPAGAPGDHEGLYHQLLQTFLGQREATAHCLYESIETILRTYHLPRERVQTAIPALADLMPSLLVWSLSTDRSSLQSWAGLLERHLVRGRVVTSVVGQGHDRWFVAPLHTSGPEDAEQAVRIAELAESLDTLPPTRRPLAVKQFQELTDLMK